MPMVSSDNGDNSNVSSDDRKASSDQLEQRVRAKIEKEKEGNMKQSTAVAVHVTCAAGHHCMADPEIAIDLINSPHECLNCCEKMHDPSTCGEMVADVEDIHGFEIPTHMLSENGQQKLREQVGASNLSICCMCIERFRLPCLLGGTGADMPILAARGGLGVIDGSPPVPIEDSIYQDSVKGKLNMKLESVGDGDEAPRPSAYTAAAYEEMDLAIKQTIQNTPQMSPPVPPAAEVKIAACAAAGYDEMDAAIKQAVKNTAQICPPLPPANVANMVAMVEDTEIENKKKAFLSPDGVGGNGGEPHVLTPEANLEQQNALSADPVQSAVSRAQAQQAAPIITRPPPRSMLPSNLKSTPSLPVLQATLVEDEPQAPVYDAIPVQSSDDQSVPWWKRRTVLGMGCVIVLLVVTLGVVVGILGNNDENESATSGSTDTEGGSDAREDSKEVTALDVFNPSQYPSQRSSTTPSFSPSDDSKEVAVLGSLQTSQYPSQRSSTTPSFSPSCVQYNYISTSPVSIADTISGKGIVFAIQSDVDDDDGLEITSLGFHVNTEDLTRSNGNNKNKGGFIEYEVYALSEGAGSPDGYYANPNRSEDVDNVLADANSYDFRGKMDQCTLRVSRYPATAFF